jgi:Major Facilitator Superfamily
MPSTPPDIGQPTREARTGREDRGQRGNKWWTLVAVCLGTFMLLLDITIVNVARPDIQRALHSSFADLQWVVDAYALTLASFLLTAGSLADMYGRRVLYLIGLVVFTGASALCGIATSTLMLQLSRGLQGVGGAIMFAVSLALLANLDSREAVRVRLQCTCGGADQGKYPRLQRVFLNSIVRMPQAESGQRFRRDGCDLRILVEPG